MDSLASSHTVHSCTARLLLIMFFALVLCVHNILAVADASASGNVQDMDRITFSSLDDYSLARIRIRGVQPGAKGLQKRSGVVPAALTGNLPPAIGKRCIARALLADISPPGMWPTPDGQDPAPVVPDEFLRRSLLTGGISPPPFGPWFATIHSTQDGEDAFLRGALVADTTYPLVQWPLIIENLKQFIAVLKRALRPFGIPAPGLSSVNTVIAKDNLQQLDKSEEHLGTVLERALLPDADIVNSSTASHEMWSDTSEHSEDAGGLQQANNAKELKFDSRRLLQADISPPGMWPDVDDDETEFYDSVLLRRRRLLNLGAISPPGMWQVSNDEDSFKRRVLLADISPPGMWPDADDGQDLFLELPPNL